MSLSSGDFVMIKARPSPEAIAQGKIWFSSWTATMTCQRFGYARPEYEVKIEVVKTCSGVFKAHPSNLHRLLVVRNVGLIQLSTAAIRSTHRSQYQSWHQKYRAYCTPSWSASPRLIRWHSSVLLVRLASPYFQPLKIGMSVTALRFRHMKYTNSKSEHLASMNPCQLSATRVPLRYVDTA